MSAPLGYGCRESLSDDGTIEAARLNEFIELARKEPSVKKSVTANYSVDFRPLREAAKEIDAKG